MPQRVVCSGKKGKLRTWQREITMGPKCLQGQDRQSALLSAESACVAARRRAEVGQADAGWQGCASLVEWAESGLEHKDKDVGRLKERAVPLRAAESMPAAVRLNHRTAMQHCLFGRGGR